MNSKIKEVQEMCTTEIIDLIFAGLDKPKLYKRSVWNKAVKVMEFLADNTNGEVTRKDKGRGLEKYEASNATKRVRVWALMYKRKIGAPLYFSDVLPELRIISKEIGVKINQGNAVLDEYFKRHPQDYRIIK